MKSCPICNIELLWANYEGVRVMSCRKCYGYLVDINALKRIKRVEQASPGQLASEADTESSNNSEYEIRCPRCLITMRKITESFPELEVKLDYCKSCSLIWFDGGELAKLQQGYETTAKAMQIRAIRQRSMAFEADPERKAKFAENVAQAPDGPESLLSAGMGRGVSQGLNRNHSHENDYGNWLDYIINILRR